MTMEDAVAAATTDFDLHGKVGIRLVGADRRDEAAVARQLGPLRARLTRDPDITVRFVDRLPIRGPLRFLGHRDVAFTDDLYIILRGRFQSSVRVALPLDRIGGPCEIICEHGIPAVPMLTQILAVTAAWRGVVPLHATAFVHEGRGVLVTGWAKGGKSETLLAFGANGATYVGDEWIYLDPADHRMYGLPEPIRVWDWQLRAMPGIASRVSRADRARLAATRVAVAAVGKTAGAPLLGPRGPGRLARRLHALLENQLSVQVPPSRLLSTRHDPDDARLDRLVLVMSHASDTIDVAPIDAALVAQRATESFLFELAELLSHRHRYRFAFGDRPMPYLDDLQVRHRTMLEAAFAGIPALSLAHPYPLDIPRLYDALADRLD